MNPIAMSALADEHIRDLHRTAARYRLAALARCCQPATWRRAASRARTSLSAWGRRGQLGPAANYCTCP
jgi:hypothetical protein